MLAGGCGEENRPDDAADNRLRRGTPAEAHDRPEGRPAYSRTRITTRRFWARFSLVLLSTTGRPSP
jgi:hypothetical protein